MKLQAQDDRSLPTTADLEELFESVKNWGRCNGFEASDVKSTGARRNSIMAARDGVSGRGVLLDIPRLKGVDGLAGLDARAVSWLHERRVAVLGSDGVSDAIPNADTERWPVPIHRCGIEAIGLHLLDNLRLDALAAACAEHGRWEFFCTLAPLRIKRGTGSPVNPVALF